MQQTSDISGTATLLRDAGGQVALQSTSAGDLSNAPAWNLHDRLGSSIATTTANGRVTDLSDYSDFGVPIFDSTGWAGTTNYTGELGDATSGLNSYFSRTYDAFAGTWLTADDYRGTLTNPGSHNRYGYVEGNPATMADSLGFRPYNPQGITPTPKVTRPSAAAAQGARLSAYGNAYNKAKASPGGATVGNSCVGRACGSNIQPDRHATLWNPPGCGTMSYNPCGVPRPTDYGPSKASGSAQNCSKLKFGLGADNVAFNKACTPWLMDQGASKGEQWQQDLYAGWKPWAAGGRTTSDLIHASAGLLGGAAASLTVGRTATTGAARPSATNAASRSAADNVADGARLRAQLAGEEIAGGHAFQKHVIDLGEFPKITTQQQFASLIEDVVTNGQIRALKNGKTGFWLDGTIVIRNPHAMDGGTAFRPVGGYEYFLNFK